MVQLLETRPGAGAVGLHNLLDVAAHNQVATYAPVRGSLIAANATPAWDGLAVGPANSVLWTDGTDPSWSAAPRLANIADPGGTNRLTLAAASPHVKVTGSLHVFGNTGERLRVGPLAPSGDNIIEATTKMGAYGDFAEVNFFKASHIGGGIFVSTWGLVRGMFGLPVVSFANAAVMGQVYGLQFTPKVVGGGGGATIAELDAIRAGYAVGNYYGTIALATGAEIEAPAFSGAGFTIPLSTGAHIGNFGNSALIADAYGHKIDDMTANTGFKRLLEVGAPYLRVIGGGSAPAGLTNVYIDEGGVVRQVQVMDPGPGGVNFAGGERAVILV